jgi:hypothetical protein
MATCEVCGNDYDKALTIELGGEKHTFDSFECAIHALAPRCNSCGVRIVGHGLESNGDLFCCRPCAERSGVQGLRDHV